MALTYDPIATTTLGSAAASHTFSSIPATYTDLIMVISAKSTTDSYVKIQYNGDTASNYSTTSIYGGSGGAGSKRGSNMTYWQTFYNYNGGDWTTQIFHIFNYANTTTFKTAILRENAPQYEVGANVGMWRKTPEAINSIKIETVSGNFNSGSTFTLYGIKAA